MHISTHTHFFTHSEKHTHIHIQTIHRLKQKYTGYTSIYTETQTDTDTHIYVYDTIHAHAHTHTFPGEHCNNTEATSAPSCKSTL